MSDVVNVDDDDDDDVVVVVVDVRSLAVWAKSRRPECRAPDFQASVHNSQLYMLYGRLVHVGETINRSADFWL